MSTRDVVTFVKRTAIAYGQKLARASEFCFFSTGGGVVCNVGPFYKRHDIASNAEQRGGGPARLCRD